VSSTEKMTAGNTLVVHGVASIKLSEGKASILGCSIAPRKHILVRPQRALPIYAETDIEVKITQDEESKLERYEGNTIPENWATVSSEVVRDHTKVMVVGKSDSGKSSFSCYLANFALLHGREVQLFDMDPGQANIGPPTTVSYAKISAPLYDPFTLYVDDATHVGYTSPSHAIQSCVNAAKDLITKTAGASSLAFSVIDSDGWVEGIEAERYKAELIETCGIDAAVFMDVPMTSFLPKELMEHNIEVFQVDKQTTLSSRGVDARRRLRSMGYRKYLKGARVRTLPTSWIRINPLTMSTEESAQDYFRNICAQTEQQPVSPSKSRRVTADKDTGLLSYGYDGTGSFSGIGLVEGIDSNGDHLRIFTPINGKIERLVLGRMILGRDGVEIYSVR